MRYIQGCTYRLVSCYKNWLAGLYGYCSC